MSFQYSDNYTKQRRQAEPAENSVRRRPVTEQHEHHHHEAHGASGHSESTVIQPADKRTEYRKLAGVFLLVAACATIMSVVMGFDWQEWIRWFMAGFFVIFGSFKLIGYENFVTAFPTYNLLAKRNKLYNYTYPFIELFLGFLYAADLAPVFRNVVTLVIMLISVYSISRALSSPRSVACVCLGSVIKLPLSNISLLEDGLMAAMAAIMLIAHFTL